MSDRVPLPRYRYPPLPGSSYLKVVGSNPSPHDPPELRRRAAGKTSGFPHEMRLIGISRFCSQYCGRCSLRHARKSQEALIAQDTVQCLGAIAKALIETPPQRSLAHRERATVQRWGMVREAKGLGSFRR